MVEVKSALQPIEPILQNSKGAFNRLSDCCCTRFPKLQERVRVNLSFRWRLHHWCDERKCTVTHKIRTDGYWSNNEWGNAWSEPQVVVHVAFQRRSAKCGRVTKHNRSSNVGINELSIRCGHSKDDNTEKAFAASIFIVPGSWCVWPLHVSSIDCANAIRENGNVFKHLHSVGDIIFVNGERDFCWKVLHDNSWHLLDNRVPSRDAVSQSVTPPQYIRNSANLICPGTESKKRCTRLGQLLSDFVL